MNAPSVDIKDILEAADLGLTFRTNLFVGKEPASPDNCVTVFDTPGGERQTTYEQGEDYHRPSIQIRARNNGYLEGYAFIQAVAAELHALGPETVNGSTYNVIKCMQEPFLLGQDENGRFWWVANFDIQRA